MLRSLSHDDVSRDELFYHTPCLTKYTNQYNNIDLTNDIWMKEPVLNTITITLYIKNTEWPWHSFYGWWLEAMYVEMLGGHSIGWSTHVSPFEDKLCNWNVNPWMVNLSLAMQVKLSQCQSSSLLRNFILEGINLKRFSKESLALAQAMMFNFCFNRDEKRRLSKKKRYNHSKRTLFLLYVAMKIYSHSRLKAIIDSGSIFVLVSQYYTFG